MDSTDGRILRAPMRRKRNDEQLCDRIKLKKVLGLTVCSNAALDCSPISGLLAYPAGCTIVLFNAKRQTQAYLVNTSRKAFTSVAFSRCGRYVATGECGINPAIKAFSPTGKYLVSVGSQHDMIVNVFDWKSNLKMASNKISSKVSAVSFAEDGSYFVTVGNRHVKYWYLEGGRKYKDPIPLMGRSAILGDLRDNDFCAVACGKGVTAESTYAITRQGHLVEFSSRRLLDKWVTCVYNDHSLYIWDMRDIKRVGKSHSFLYHSTCIWGVETVPYNMEREMSPTLPEDSFVTCSSDDTIRVWGLEGCANNEIYRKNIYSKELLKVIYIDDEMNFIKDLEIVSDKSAPIPNSSYDGRNGVRCIKISPELQHLASGDRSGNIRIYNLNNLKLITTIEAHESEVLCLEYSNEKIERKLLASASRDRLIHGNIFLRGTHTSGKTTLYDMEVDSNAKHILTACQDRNIRVYGTQNSKHTKTFKGSHSDEGSLIKLSLDPSGIYVATSCTDKTLAVYDYYSNECMARMYGHSELVTGLKFTNDCRHLISASGDGCVFVWQVPHDMIVTMQARLSQQRLRSGHAPIPRPLSAALVAPEGIIVESPTPDIDDAHKFSLSPSILQGDVVPLTPGYKLSDVGQLPQWAKRKAGAAPAAAVDNEPSGLNIPSSANSSSMTNLSSSPSQAGLAQRPRNRWAQRGQIDADTLTDIRSNSESPLGSVSTTAGIGPALHGSGLGNTQTSDYNSASSKDIMYNQTYLSEDSSIDSGMETRRELKFIGSNNTGTVPTVTATVAGANRSSATLVADKRKPGLRFDTISNNDHDGDIEDISDGERTSSDHGIDFKVTAMNEEELRKSVRRQKFEKAGLTLSGNGSHTASTGTGTGTSDTEDEGSTPSADNADRSLASTLGGSSESRRSISAKHNNESGKPGSSAPPTITKSYTSTKKEELLKVINEAKQKLENVGYRSLRGSHSISDLSLAGNLDGSRSALSSANPLNPKIDNSQYISATSTTTDKPTYADRTPPNYYSPPQQPSLPASQPQQYFFNCAAPKSVLQQNCQAMRKVQQHYPPYPHHVGVHQIHPPPGVPFMGPTNSNKPSANQKTFTSSTLPANSQAARAKRNPNGNNRRTPSILKHYKSCPVSPVHEEVEWSSDSKSIIITEPKRHSVYADDARTILDMIQADTEKMIAEITKKYGDLDDIGVDVYDHASGTRHSQIVASKSVPENLATQRSNLPMAQKRDLAFTPEGATSPRGIKQPYVPLAPKHSFSEFYVYQEIYQCERKVSLSDILNDNPEQMAEARRLEEARFLETQRHSSASFFLTSNNPFNVNRSQESLLTEEFLDDASYCNSMESVSKSISSDFAQQRWQRNSNPMQSEKECYNDKLFQKKVVKEKPPIPAKPENLKSTLTSTVEAVQKLQVKEPLKKSCSFEVDTSDIRCHSRTASVVRKFERNLQKFEREKQAELQVQKKKNNEARQMRPSVSSGALATQSCLKKVSKFDNSPSRRATSMRQKERPKISVRFNTVSQIKYTPSSKRNNANNSSLTTTCPLNDINLNVSPPLGSSLPNDYGEKTFEMFITENGNDEHDNMTMDSLKLYTKPTLQAVVDEIKQERERDTKHKKNLANKEITQNPIHDTSTTNQCKNIAKQIDVIQKLIEMEERKLEQIRQATESRMRPFECDTKQRGYVKSLTMNFDMLAKGIEKDIENEQRRILADSSDSDLCAYARHIKRNVSLPDVLESAKSASSSQKTGAAHRNSSATRSASKRNSLQNKGSSNNLSANASMGVLNQSDSETEANNPPPQDDSSSEETQGSSSNTKPIVPPRPRNLAFDHKNKVVNSPNVVKQRGVYEAVEFADLDSNGDPKSQVHNVINKLYTTTQTVLQLHANLRNCEDSLMLKELENAVIMTQNMLTNITQNKNDKNNQHPNHTYSTTEQANLENGDYMMMQFAYEAQTR
ncbi:WD repeat-containing protein 62 [Lucilia cuprina]|nr:WD repeat-containing protein 62 [Lucilia cuprina]